MVALGPGRHGGLPLPENDLVVRGSNLLSTTHLKISLLKFCLPLQSA